MMTNTGAHHQTSFKSILKIFIIRLLSRFPSDFGIISVLVRKVLDFRMRTVDVLRRSALKITYLYTHRSMTSANYNEWQQGDISSIIFILTPRNGICQFYQNSIIFHLNNLFHHRNNLVWNIVYSIIIKKIC